jgi:hypothetical protein
MPHEDAVTIRLSAGRMDWDGSSGAERARMALGATVRDRVVNQADASAGNPRALIDRARQAWRTASQGARTPAELARAWQTLDTQSRIYLGALVATFAVLERDPLMSFDAARLRAAGFLDQAKPPADMAPAQLQLYEHISSVERWVDVAALRQRQLTPFQLLKLSYSRHDKRLDDAITLAYTRRTPFDAICLGEAAALHYLQSGNGTAQPGGSGSFVTLLEAEIADSRRALLLIREPGDPLATSNCTVDRYVVEGCFGKRPADIVADARAAWQARPDNGPPQSGGSPAASGATAAELAYVFEQPEAEQVRLLKRAFALMGESADFPIGSPFQSMDTVLLRTPRFRAAGGSGDAAMARLFDEFGRLYQSWRHAPGQRQNPLLLAGQHLARASGHLILAEGATGPQFIRQAMLRRHASLQALDASTRDAIEAWANNQASFPQPGLPQDSSLSSEARAFIELIREDCVALQGAPRLIGAQAVVNYFTDRLGAYRALPAFDALQVLTDVLTARGITPEQLATTRSFQYFTEIPPLWVQVSGTPIAECALRSLLMKDNEIQMGEDTVNCRRELYLAREAFTGNYPRLPAVMLKARELYLYGDRSQSPEQIAQRIAQQQLSSPASALGLIDFLRRITIMAPFESIAKALLSGQPREIAGLFPFVVPAYDIVEGMWTRNAADIEQGAIGMTTDAILVWVGGMAESGAVASAERAVAQIAEESAPSGGSPASAGSGPTSVRGIDAVRMPIHEAVSLPALADLAYTEPAMEAAACVPPCTSLRVEHDPYGVMRADAVERAEYERQKARAAAGEAVYVDLPGDQHARLAWLPIQRRTALIIERPGKHFGHEVDEHGAPLAGGALLERAGESNRYFSASDHHIEAAGKAELAPPDRNVLERRPSLIEARSALDGALRGTRRGQLPDWNRLFDIKVKPSGSDVWRRNPKSAARVADEEVAALVDTLNEFYRSSSTFEALVDHAYDRLKEEGWAVHIEPTVSPHVRPGKKAIFLPYHKERIPGNYMTSTRQAPFSRKRATLHEMLHAVTGKNDPVVTKRVAEEGPEPIEEHRGAVVALTDRILYEANVREPPRVMYSAPFSSNLRAQVDYSKRLERFLSEADMFSFYEDREIDRMINAHRPVEKMLVGGQRVETRATVASVMRLRRFINLHTAGVNTVREPFEQRWGDTFLVDRGTPAEQPAADAMHAAIDVAHNIRDTLNDVYLHVSDARILFDLWYEQEQAAPGARQWTINASPGEPPLEHAQTPFVIDRDARTITLYDQRLYYMSDDGVRQYEPRRRYVGMLAELVAGDRGWDATGAVDSHTNRGVLVYLEELFLRTREVAGAQVADEEPNRTSRQLASNPDVLREFLSRACRMAVDENRYLREAQAKLSGASGSGCWSTGLCGRDSLGDGFVPAVPEPPALV